MSDENGLTWPDMRATGVSYRRLDYWTRNGWLRLNPTRFDRDPVIPGSGIERRWAHGEDAVVRRVVGLTDAGMTPQLAFRIARGIEAGAPVELLPDVVVTRGGGAV